MKTNFFIVGAAKAGTTSLHNYFMEHSDIFMPEIKEPNYFAYDEIINQNLFYKEKGVGTLEDYQNLFSTSNNEKALGEASVSYLYYKDTPQKIKDYNPNSKIIILLRDPIKRAHSHYLMDNKLGYTKVSFESIVNKSSNHKLQELYYQQYIDLGMYYEQVKRYLDTFGESNVKIFLNEDLKNDTKGIVKELYNFLKVDSADIPDITKKHNTYKKPKENILHSLFTIQPLRSFISRILPKSIKVFLLSLILEDAEKPEIENKTLIQLKKLYLEDINKLEELINRDLSSWK